VCNALKRLQTANLPFEDELAFAVLRESLNWDGPIAPGIDETATNKNQPTLFAWMSESPIAVASLGQVYKATTHEGLDVAVKIQRPDGMALLAKDAICFKVVLATMDFIINLQPGKAFDKGLIGNTVDRVATDMANELDYCKEALSGKKFEESLGFLGFVRTPKVLPNYSSERVLVTEFVKGNHLNALSQKDGLAMTRMAVEACTASLVLTGFVHADPHEGNLMLDEDGHVVFLDFGLMSDVEDTIMEAFAQGIQACLAEDWTSLTNAFKSSGFISNPIEWKLEGSIGDATVEFEPVGVDPVTGVDLGIAILSKDLEDAMRGEEGGTSRFGALAAVLNSLSEKWKMSTPPYVLLLIRTFLTLEGIAGRVDPEFNIYEMAMPWAIRRSLSPSTMEGIKALRATLLTKDDRIQWTRFLEFVETATATPPPPVDEVASPAATGSEPAAADTAPPKQSSTDAAKQGAMNDAVVTLIGSPEGFVLRRLIRDLDSIDLVSRLLSKDAKPLRKQAVLALSAEEMKRSSLDKTSSSATDAVAMSSSSEEDAAAASATARPMSEECAKLRERQLKWTRRITMMLVQQHLVRQLKGGPKAWIKLSILSLRLVAGLINRRILFYVRRGINCVVPSSSRLFSADSGQVSTT